MRKEETRVEGSGFWVVKGRLSGIWRCYMNGKHSDDIILSIDSHQSAPKIPKKLEDAGFRFIRILPRSKNPRDTKYTTANNFSHEDPEITTWLNHYSDYEVKTGEIHESGDPLYRHIEGYGNYGCLGSDTAIIIDLDSPVLIEKLLGDALLSDTYLCRSGSGKGIHAYYRTSGARTIPLKNSNGENIGHVKAGGGYCVGPGSIHPSGGLYTVLSDAEIATVDFSYIENFFSEYIKKQQEPETDRVRPRSYDSTIIDIPIEDILPPGKPIRKGNGEIQGEHPVHGSTGGRNLSINTIKNTYFCHRCQTGGGPAEAIAVRHGLLNCSDISPGCLRGELFRQVLQIAGDEYGYIQPVKQHPKRPSIIEQPAPEPTFGILEELTQLTTLPEVLPDTDVILVDAYPRIGKSHWADLQAIKHKTANIIANTHSVIEHHLHIFTNNRNPGQTAVHLEGKNRCCNRSGEGKISCSGCQFYPYSSDPSDRGTFISYVHDYLFSEEIITSVNVPDNYCVYFFLKEAAKVSDYVFTVTENLEEITGENHHKRHLTIIDEDTCFASFFPQSAELAEFTRISTRHHVQNILEAKWIGIQKWKDYIIKGKKRPKGKETILRMIEVLEEIRNVLRISDDKVFDHSDIIRKLNALDTSVPDPTDITKSELIRLIERWEIQDSFSPFAMALLYPYHDRKFMWQGYKHMKLRMIADEEVRIRDPPDTKMILIGSTRAELFLKTLEGLRTDIIRLDVFPYSDYFLFVVIKEQQKPGSRLNKHAIRTALKTVVNTNSTWRYPVLILTGTKREQEMIISDFGGICKGSSDEDETGQRWNYQSGCFNVFYQNSVISRGVDVPFYKSLFLLSSDFASPYWIARIDVARTERSRDDYDYAEEVRDAITVDETTNSILRITPTPSTLDGIPRVVVLSERDLWKIKPGVMQNSTIIEVLPDMLTDNLESVLQITGGIELLPPEEMVLFPEDSVQVINQHSKSIFKIPPELVGKPVKVKCEYLSHLVSSSDKQIEKWRKKLSPVFIEKVERSIVDRLKFQDGYHMRMTILVKWIVSRYKPRITKPIAEKMVKSMMMRYMVRINGVGEKAVVRLPSSYP